MEDFLGDISTEIDFILQRHSSNLSRFKALHGIRSDSDKYAEIFDQTLISAKQEIAEAGTRAVEKRGVSDPKLCDEIQLLLAKSLRRFVLVNRRSR